MPRTRVFYAFPGQPANLSETIENAITLLKTDRTIRRKDVRFSPWTDMKVGGRQLVETILKNIDRSDVFACDLTHPNFNVSFELGYAIGRFKRVWISLDSSIETAEQQYRKTFYGIIGAGYTRYHNSQDLAGAFITDNPTNDLEQKLLGETYRSPGTLQEEPVLLYVKPPIITDSVIKTTQVLEDSIFSNALTIDDPIENSYPTLEWYAGKLKTADAVLCHLLGTERAGHEEHNAKCSLLAGLARGFNKPLLMLAQTPFESPIDFRKLLLPHDTASECEKLVRTWIDELQERLPNRRPRRPDAQFFNADDIDLRGLPIGEPVAENERQKLDSYFVETSTYFRSMEEPVTIVVGRRGTGKSAQLLAMQNTLARDRRNHVCVVKPAGYEIDGLVRVLESIESRSERGYLVESLWKFLLYSEVARSVVGSITSRPPYYEPTESEAELLKYYDDYKQTLAPPFSERLDATLRSLVDVGTMDDPLNQRERISEALHSNQLRDLRDILGRTLSNYNKVAILIDNLDGQWGTNEHIGPLSELLWGLLLVADEVVAQFRIEDHWRVSANVHLTIFLRSDIFALIQPTAPEQDKLPIQRIVWDDPEVLRRLIDQRIEFGGARTYDAQKVWDQFFPSDVMGSTAWEFVINTTLPRPRDIIYMIREAIDGAINRGHKTVTKEDMLDAREKYSEYVFRSIQAEDDPRKGMLQPIMYEFAGSPRYLTRSQIASRFNEAGVDPQYHEFYIDLLCDVNFLAIASNQGYEYAKHEADRTIKRNMAERLATDRLRGETYQVSSAFWQVLQVEQGAI